jgi:5'(3')-deoxyribonucleotidase
MDEVMADANLRFSEWYERDYARQILPQEIHGKYFSDAVSPEHRDLIIGYLHTDGFFKGLAVIKGSQEVIF